MVSWSNNPAFLGPYERVPNIYWGGIYRQRNALKYACYLPHDNQPPRVITIAGVSIPDQTLRVSERGDPSCSAEEDSTSFTTDLRDLFDDPDGDLLTYTASSDLAGVRARISGNTLMVTASEEALEQRATIMVTASDDETASLSFGVRVENCNRPPEATGGIAPQILGFPGVEGSSCSEDPFTVDVSPLFDDPDPGDDVLIYTASSSDSGSYTATIVPGSSTLRVAPVSEEALGRSAIITVTATDDDDATGSLEFMVSGCNRPPKAIGTIPDQVLSFPGVRGSCSANRDFTVDVSPLFDDPDPDDVLAYTATSSDSGSYTATIEPGSSTLRVAPVHEEALGRSATITVTATDDDDATGSLEFMVSGCNRPPEAIGAIATQVLSFPGVRGSCSADPDFTVDVSPLFDDPDPGDDVLTYTATSSDPGRYTATIAPGSSTLRVVIVNEEALGRSATITVTATDDDDATGSLAFTVSGCNRPPEATGAITTQILSFPGVQGSCSADPDFTVDVSSLFDDPDPDDDVLTYTASSSDSDSYTATITPGSSTLRVAPVSEEALGSSATITVTATDDDDATGSLEFMVSGCNRPPEAIDDIPPQVLGFPGIEGSCSADPDFTVDVSPLFDDPDPGDDVLTYTATSSDSGSYTAIIAPGSSTLRVATVREEALGSSATITVTATDDGGATGSLAFTVSGCNRPPEAIGSISHQQLRVAGFEGDSICNAEYPNSFSQDVSSLFTDPDDDPLTYTANSSVPEVRAGIPSGSSRLTVTAGRAAPELGATITVTARDPDGGTDSFSFDVNVAENTPIPVFSKPSLFLDEAPFDHAISDLNKGGRDSYSVTLSCQYRNDVTVEITNTAIGVPADEGTLPLEVKPTTLAFNSTNWNVPQTVSVHTANRVLADDDTTLQEFSLPHLAITTNSQGETVRQRSNLAILVKPATVSTLRSLLDEVAEYYLGWLISEGKKAAQEKTKDYLLENTKGKTNTILKEALKNLGRVAGPIGAVQSALGWFDTFRTLIEMYGSNQTFTHNLAENLFLNHEVLQDGSLGWQQALSGQRFSVPLNLRFSQVSSRNQDTSAPPFNALLSGSFNFSRSNDSANNFEFDGTTTSYALGLDVLPNPDLPLLTGLRFVFTQSRSDFEDEEITTEGSHDLQMATVHPYISWEPTDLLGLWASLGYGRGQAKLTIDSIADARFNFINGASTTTTGDLFSIAAGASLQVWQSDAMALAIQLGGSHASFLGNELQQGRLATQLSGDLALDKGLLSSSVNLALLLSNSDTSAAELSGSLSWFPFQSRLSGSHIGTHPPLW